jgi:hypothetical protein
MIQFVLEMDRALFEDAMKFAQQQVRKLDGVFCTPG